MKLSLATLALSVPATAAYTVGGFDTFGRPYFVAPRRGRYGRSRCTPSQNGRECVDKAFEDLQKDLYNRNERFRPRGNTPSPEYRQRFDEEAIRQQEEWFKRAFGLATDVAKGMTATPQEAEQADKAIRQSKEFVDNIFGFAKDLSSGGVYSNIRSEILQDDETAFQVSFDVPGVKAQNIDVTVEGTQDKVLVVRGKRESGRDEEGRKFSKTIPLNSKLDTEKVSANLENGVLVVTVPRLAVEKTEQFVQKVAVSKASASETIQGDSETFPFELEIDVPGVSASNIDITIEGDTDKTLTIKAVREVGKDNEGNPRTKEISKSFKVDELVDTSKIVANLNDGVLRVAAPADAKKKEESVRKIKINPDSAATSDTIQGSATNEKEETDSGAEDEGENEK